MMVINAVFVRDRASSDYDGLVLVRGGPRSLLLSLLFANAS